MIHTDGNGALLERVFLSLSHILYGDAEGIRGTFRLLVRLSLTIGAFAALSLAFFRQKFEPLIKSFFLPGLAIIALLLTPRTALEIRDHSEEGRKRRVENVPWFLGQTAGWSSELFYRVKTLFESSIRTHYPWTRQIHAGKSPFRFGRLSFSDLQLEANLRGFCRECVFRDLGLGLYSREELSRSPDLFSFFKERSARNRTMLYQERWIPCKEAIEKIDASLTGDLLVDALVDGELTVRERGVRALLKGEEKQWIKQQIAIQLLKEELSKRKSERSFSVLAASSLLSLRNFSEALLYLIFPLILLLALLSFGLKLILQWLRLLVWISLWPILYVAVDLFLQALWESRLPERGLTLGTQDEISELYGSMEITAAFLIASIPFFTWALLKGGISQIAHQFSVSTAHEIKLPESKKEERAPSIGVQEAAPKQTFRMEASLQMHQQPPPLSQAGQQETIRFKEQLAAAALPRISVQETEATLLHSAAIKQDLKERAPEEPKEIVNMHAPAREDT